MTRHQTRTDPGRAIEQCPQTGPDPELMTERKTILVAEDESDLVTLYEVWLQDEFDVITAQDGREAIEALPSEIDALICDRGMPHVTGEEVIEQLDAAGWEVPVIVVSSRRPDSELGRDDVAAYLTKPVDRESVTSAVRRVLG